MRVLFLATRDYYHPATTGGDITLWEHARYLAHVGHAVTFVAAGYRGAPQAETLDGISVVRLGGIHSLWLRTFLYYITRSRGRFDAVVAEGFGGSRIPRLAPLYVREPFITEWHQVHRALFAAQYPKLLGPALNVLERFTAWVHRNTLVRAGTAEWAQAFATIGFKANKIFMVPVSIREGWLGDTSNSASRDPRVVWLGKFRRYKCPHHAILAMPQVVRSVPNAKLVLAGRHDDQKYERAMRDLVDELSLNSHVEFRFDITDAEKRQLLVESSVMVVTSVVEGFGIVVLEANASGLPVVASSGVPESVVQNRWNGLRYSTGDIDGLSRSITAILCDRQLREELSSNGVAFAKRFAWHDVGMEFERVLRAAVDTRSGP